MKLVLCVLPNPNKNRKEKLQSHSSSKYRWKMPSKMIAKLIQKYIKEKTLHEKLEVSSGIQEQFT